MNGTKFQALLAALLARFPEMTCGELAARFADVEALNELTGGKK